MCSIMYLPMLAKAFAACMERVKPLGPLCNAISNTSFANCDNCSACLDADGFCLAR